MKDELKTRLMSDEFGLTEDHIQKLTAEGVTSEEDLKLLSAEQIKLFTGCNTVQSLKIVNAFAPVSKPLVDPNAVIPEGEKPSPEHVKSFANSLGMDPNMLSMIMLSGMTGNAGLGAMDISGMIPIAQIVEGYNPKVRNMYLMIMGQFENRFGVPIVVINKDGDVNKGLTVEYMTSLEEGHDVALENIYYDGEGNPFQVIAVGVDAQSIYDADPLNTEHALPKSMVGIGRIAWKDVPLEVRQTTFFAVQTGEVDSANESSIAWLRDNIKPGVSRLIFSRQAPKAVNKYNEALRTGTLPTLRVMLNRKPRRKEFMPRRTNGKAGLGVTNDDL